MCIFITLITKASDKSVVSEILLNAGRHADLIDNLSLRAAIAEDEIQLLTTNGHCDCDTALGHDSVKNAVKNFDEEVRKLRRKKWSQGKIDRYLEDRRKAEEKKMSGRTSDSVDLWESVIAEAHKHNVSRIALFYTMYSGAIISEIIQPTVTETTLWQDTLKTMAENEIVYFS